MATLKEIKRLKELAAQYELENREILDQYKLTELAGIYNGIGPERMPKWMRDAITFLHPTLQPVSLIHDIEYEIGGSHADFEASNRRFYTNGCRVARIHYAWYNPLRYFVMSKARRFSLYCDLFGWVGWAKHTTNSAG